MWAKSAYRSIKRNYKGTAIFMLLSAILFAVDSVGRIQTVATLWPSVTQFFTNPTVRNILPWVYIGLLTLAMGVLFRAVRRDQPGVEAKPETLPTQEQKPVVLLKYEWEEHHLLGTPIRVIRNKPFLLLSRDADVFDVQIQPIVRQCGTATFESISSILKGGEASIPANIQGVGVLQQHDFEILLIKEWEAGGDISTIGEPIVVLVSVTYSDSQGRKFKTEHEVKYKPLHKTAKTHFKGVLAE